jgi:hypothetical protein
MKHALVLLFWTAGIAGLSGQTFSFDKDQPGTLPAGWNSAQTHAGGAPKWEVLRDPTAPSRPNVLGQTSTDRTPQRFPIAILEQFVVRSGDVSVRFKPVSGAVDQSAGLVWRYRGPNDYYLARADALTREVVLYRVQAGRLVPLAPLGAAPKRVISAGAWNTLRVTFRGRLLTVYLNAVQVLEAEDGTFAEPGFVGLWTKSDSVSYFDDFQVKAVAETGP